MKARLNKAVLILVCMMMIFSTIPASAKGNKVNINKDSKEQLMTLKYVGEALAKRIIEYRKKTPFKTIQDITKVKGVGPKVFEANKDKITVKDTK